MSQDDVNSPLPSGAAESQDAGDALRRAEALIRKLDEESRKKLEQVTVADKTNKSGAA